MDKRGFFKVLGASLAGLMGVGAAKAAERRTFYIDASSPEKFTEYFKRIGNGTEVDHIPDWRDALLGTHLGFTLVFQHMSLGHLRARTIRLIVYQHEKMWAIGHYHKEYDYTLPLDESRTVAQDLEGAHRKFDTLREAAEYGIYLKQKYYGKV